MPKTTQLQNQVVVEAHCGLPSLLKNKLSVQLIDVRRASEFDSEHVMDALNIPLDYINENKISITSDKTIYVHCRSGYRSMVFVSLLRTKGFRNLVDISGGFNDMKASGQFELTEYVCPTTML